MSTTIPNKAIDIEGLYSELRDWEKDYIEKLNKPILTIAPSSIAATIAFVGAIGAPEKITNIGGFLLLASWGAWLLAVLLILISYYLVLKAIKSPLKIAEQFSTLDLAAVTLQGETLEESISRNHSMFKPKDNALKWSDRCQWLSLLFFGVGFLSFFSFVSIHLIWVGK